ncbi:hypothetical protein D3C81_1713430 [compost metagenome]
MRSRRDKLPRSCISKGRLARISRAAPKARLEETGLRLTFQIDSSACDSASRPLANVVDAGTLSISDASISAVCGQVHAQCSEYLLPAAASHTVAHGVTSLPVPAVVGIAIKALAPTPDNWVPPRRCCSSSSKRPDGVGVSMTLAQSMTLPPPSAMMHSTSA